MWPQQALLLCVMLVQSHCFKLQKSYQYNAKSHHYPTLQSNYNRRRSMEVVTSPPFEPDAVLINQDNSGSYPPPGYEPREYPNPGAPEFPNSFGGPGIFNGPRFRFDGEFMPNPRWPVNPEGLAPGPRTVFRGGYPGYFGGHGFVQSRAPTYPGAYGGSAYTPYPDSSSYYPGSFYGSSRLPSYPMTIYGTYGSFGSDRRYGEEALFSDPTNVLYDDEFVVTGRKSHPNTIRRSPNTYSIPSFNTFLQTNPPANRSYENDGNIGTKEYETGYELQS